ncbi:MAG: sel1 repeat family protein [Porticoccaceae bacterium]|nr:sel1 repeat family protein [Porticoccaceae bacterium]
MTKLKTVFLILFIFLSLPSLASNGEIADTSKTRQSTAVLSDYRQDAERGDRAAQYALGEIYARGEGVRKNHDEALKWYRKAAEQNHVQAQYMLGMIYTLGLVGHRDYIEAVKWLGKAADQSHGKAQLMLGKMYAHGVGVSTDYVQAYKWLNLASVAAMKGAAEAHELVALTMTPDQLKQGEQLSQSWWAEHVE